MPTSDKPTADPSPTPEALEAVESSHQKFSVTIRGQKWHLSWNPKPIPTKAYDWDWGHDDYDGPGDTRCGSAASVLGCLEEILDYMEDHDQ